MCLREREAGDRLAGERPGKCNLTGVSTVSELSVYPTMGNSFSGTGP